MLAFVLILFLWAATPAQTARQADSARRAHLAELYNAGDQEGFLKACRDLVQYHKENQNERELFNAYATLLDRLQVMGRFVPIIGVLSSSYRPWGKTTGLSGPASICRPFP